MPCDSTVWTPSWTGLAHFASISCVQCFSLGSWCLFCDTRSQPFCAKKSFNLGSEMRKTKLQTIVGNLLDELRKLNMNGTVTGIEDSRQYLLLRTDDLQKTVVENPCFFMLLVSRLPFVKYFWNYLGLGSALPESKKIYLFVNKICLNKIWLTCIHVLNRGSLLFDHWSHFTCKKTSNKIHSPLRFLFLRNFNSEDHQPKRKSFYIYKNLWKCSWCKWLIMYILYLRPWNPNLQRRLLNWCLSCKQYFIYIV